MLELVARHGITVAGNVFRGLGEVGALVRLAESGGMVGKGLLVVDAGQVGGGG